MLRFKRGKACFLGEEADIELSAQLDQQEMFSSVTCKRDTVRRGSAFLPHIFILTPCHQQGLLLQECQLGERASFPTS